MIFDIGPLLASTPVIPVVVIDRLHDAVPLATALVAGGLSVIEVTLRTPQACEAIRQIRDALPEAQVGAGTIVTPGDVERAVAAGARFLVSPGCTAALAQAALASGLPYLPGVATPSEAMQAAEYGFSYLKFFPAEAAGGIDMLRAIAGPLPGLRFCPTGGITSDSAAQYLRLSNVCCVGGSWLTPKEALRSRRWSEVESLARAAAALRGT